MGGDGGELLRVAVRGTEGWGVERQDLHRVGRFSSDVADDLPPGDLDTEGCTLQPHPAPRLRLLDLLVELPPAPLLLGQRLPAILLPHADLPACGEGAPDGGGGGGVDRKERVLHRNNSAADEGGDLIDLLRGHAIPEGDGGGHQTTPGV